MPFPTDLLQMIAAYAIPPIYHIAECLRPHINWYGLCSNSHPAMISLVDDYFQECLAQSPYLSYGLLHRLSTNPTALPLLRKYHLYLQRYSIHVQWDVLQELYELSDPYLPHPNNAMLLQKDELSAHPNIVELITNGQIDLNRVVHKQGDILYQNPAIFQLNVNETEESYKKWMALF